MSTSVGLDRADLSYDENGRIREASGQSCVNPGGVRGD
jgi:hypothetical protein